MGQTATLKSAETGEYRESQLRSAYWGAEPITGRNTYIVIVKDKIVFVFF